MQFHVDGMPADGAPLPAPSPLDAVLRINITCEQRLVKDADAFAARCGTSRAALIAEALKARLAKG